MTNVPRFPDVTVQLTGQDGNAFAVIGRVQRALTRGGYRSEALEFTSEAYDAESYEDLLRLSMSWVDVV